MVSHGEMQEDLVAARHAKERLVPAICKSPTLLSEFTSSFTRGSMILGTKFMPTQQWVTVRKTILGLEYIYQSKKGATKRSLILNIALRTPTRPKDRTLGYKNDEPPIP
jgi:hypothetical protein